MAWRAYNTVNEQILGETSAAGARPLDYQLDALGSVVGTIKTNGTLENTYRYAGYGQRVSKTGIGNDPIFQWVGGWGYRATYVLSFGRSRHFAMVQARWMARDRLWPEQSGFAYCDANPTSLYDPSGDNVECLCAGKLGTIKGYPKTGKYYKCYLKWCNMMCPMPDPFTDAAKACNSIPDCTLINDDLPMCTGGAAWIECGQYFTVPGGPGWNGSPANDSNYPSPAWQAAIGKHMCCVECRMRWCCANYSLLQDWLALLHKGFKKCREKGYV